MSEASVIQMLESGQSDMAWFESNLDSLKSRYNNKFIAFHNKAVVDYDTKLDNLIKRINEKGIDSSNIFVRFVSKVKAIL